MAATAQIIDLAPFANPEVMARRFASNAVLPESKAEASTAVIDGSASPIVTEASAAPWESFCRQQGMAWKLIGLSTLQLCRQIAVAVIPRRPIVVPYWVLLGGALGWAGSVSFLSTLWILSAGIF